MRLIRSGRGVALGCVLLGTVARPASADIVRLANGRSFTIDGYQVAGTSVILTMRGGGRLTVPREAIAEVSPDDLPGARASARAALAHSRTAAGPLPTPAAIRSLITRVATRVGLDLQLAHAIVQVESNYQPLAVSPRGAMGLMQIMPDVAAEYDLADPFDPEQNLDAGMRHLRALLGRFDDVRRALAAYNAGAGAVTRYGGVPPYVETRTYVQRILTLLHGPARW